MLITALVSTALAKRASGSSAKKETGDVFAVVFAVLLAGVLLTALAVWVALWCNNGSPKSAAFSVVLAVVFPEIYLLVAAVRGAMSKGASCATFPVQRLGGASS